MSKETFLFELDQRISQVAEASGKARSEIRPFVCDGSPLDSSIFIVGTNPASTVPWEEYWDWKIGRFDKERWMARYVEERIKLKAAQGKTRIHPVSLTRRRLELFGKSIPHYKILETNVYAVPTSSESELSNDDLNVNIFKYLVEVIGPSAMFVHGDSAMQVITKIWPMKQRGVFHIVQLDGHEIVLLSVPHLAARNGLVTNEKVLDWALLLRRAIEQPNTTTAIS